jgi:hypothetical protein
MAAKNYLETGKNFHLLTLRDVLEARDAYHVYLTRRKNVIGTAVGKFRLRPDKERESTGEKTLANTALRPFSWPCVMVFVSEWIPQEDFTREKKNSVDDYVPKYLYMPDGRMIPVCVIKADWRHHEPQNSSSVKNPGNETDNNPSVNFPRNVTAAGYPVFTTVQGKRNVATYGCLVSDGRLLYGLTSAHVTGRPGEPLYTIGDREIGVSSDKQLRKVPFSAVYPDIPCRDTLINLDVGLIEFSNADEVSSMIFSQGAPRGILDVNHDTLSLNLIGCPVKAYGFVSGNMYGEITGLFYRYTTSGGYDYVTDYLVTPRFAKSGEPVLPFHPGPGDSGALLLCDNPRSEDNMKAIGMLWGGQVDAVEKKKRTYGLFSNLGTICQQLGVELVCDWNTRPDVFFGCYAHFVLPGLSVGLLKNTKLKSLMTANQAVIGMPLVGTSVKATKGYSKDTVPFTPLANVADLRWKTPTSSARRLKENPNHFADMDKPNPRRGNKTLLDVCKDQTFIDPAAWLKFYLEIGEKNGGLLPFRIAQIFSAAIGYLKAGKRAEFMGAAGIMVHYVFDACLPLHISYMFNGDPLGEKREVNGKKQLLAKGIHDEFDNTLMEIFSEDVKKRLRGMVREQQKNITAAGINGLKTSRDVAVTVVALMRQTIKNSAPVDIVRYYETLVDLKQGERCRLLWDKYGGALLKSIAGGVALNALLWEAAWKLGGGDSRIKDFTEVEKTDLKALYELPDFLPSYELAEFVAKAKW